MQASQVADRDVSEEHESLVKGGFQLLIRLALAASPQLHIHILGNQLCRPAGTTTTAKKEIRRNNIRLDSIAFPCTWQSARQACMHHNHCSKGHQKEQHQSAPCYQPSTQHPHTWQSAPQACSQQKQCSKGHQKEQHQAGQHSIPMHPSGTWQSAWQACSQHNH